MEQGTIIIVKAGASQGGYEGITNTLTSFFCDNTGNKGFKKPIKIIGIGDIEKTIAEEDAEAIIFLSDSLEAIAKGIKKRKKSLIVIILAKMLGKKPFLEDGVIFIDKPGFYNPLCKIFIKKTSSMLS